MVSILVSPNDARSVQVRQPAMQRLAIDPDHDPGPETSATHGRDVCGRGSQLMFDSIESLFELDSRCSGKDAELWRCLAIGAANDLGLIATNHLDALTALRKRSWHDWPAEIPDRAVSGEVNHYLARTLNGEDDMATATKRKKTETLGNKQTIPVDSLADAPEDNPWEELSDIVKDNALKQLCCPTAAEGMEWARIREAGMSDEDLYEKLGALWVARVHRSTPPCSASSGMGSPLVWFGTVNAVGSPSLSGDDLVDNVRRVMRIPLPKNVVAENTNVVAENTNVVNPKANVVKPGTKAVSPETKPAIPETIGAVSGTLSASVKGKAKAAKADKVTAAELFAGVEVLDERDVPWDDINRSKQNPRQSFDEQLIADMEPNIEQICRLTPLTIREGTNELIDGETRHRSAAKRKAALRCKIIRCTDAQAAAMRLLSAVQRRDLNPIEKAASIKSLQEEHGLSQRQLEDLVKLKQGTISNMVRLLDLPDDWQQRVISGEITPADARELVPWKSEAAVMKDFAESFKSDGDEKWFDFSDELQSAVINNSSPLKGSRRVEGTFDHINYELKPTNEQRQQLRIRQVKRYGNQTEERAFNVDLCDELVNAIVAKKSAKKKTANSTSEVSPEKAKENAKKQAEQLAKRLYRFRVGWYQTMCRASIHSDDGATENEIIAILLFIGSTNEGASGRRGTLQKLLKAKGNGGHQSEYSKLLAALMHSAEAGGIQGFVTELVYDQLGQNFTAYNNVLQPQEIEALAGALKIDIGRDWVKSFAAGPCLPLWDEFCGLWSKDQILKLLDEWKIKRPDKVDSMKRADLAKLLTAGKGCPKAILNAKPVRLT